jgi:hypothetical protein
MILSGEKTWEIRGHFTHARDNIALIRGGSGLIVGTCELTGVVGPLTRQEFRGSASKAGLARSEARSLPYKKTYAWALQHPRKLKRPRPYKHPSGAVIWVRIPSG